MIKVGVYGGSFDPISIGHLILAFQVLNSKVCDQVWVIPSGEGRSDKSSKSSGQHRIEMCKLAIQELYGFAAGKDAPIQVCDVEIRKGFIPTSCMISVLKSEYSSGYEFQLIIGSDLLKDLWTWTNGSDVLRSGMFLVVPRLPYKSQITKNTEDQMSSPLCKCGMFVKDMPRDVNKRPMNWKCVKCEMIKTSNWTLMETNVASEEIRKRIVTNHRNEDLKIVLGGIVPPSVIQYITQNKLYKLS